ncbi:MAG: hypothetical protein AAFQ80_20160 [Cyanobacteria bacterium J06621_8]
MPAEAIVQDITINGDRGYQVQISFSFDETRNVEKLEGQRVDVSNGIDHLRINFYDPTGSLMMGYDNIVDSRIQGEYFEFHYDLQQQKIFGALDLGGESVGEIFLKGDASNELALIKIKSSGNEKVLDQISVRND